MPSPDEFEAICLAYLEDDLSLTSAIECLSSAFITRCEKRGVHPVQIEQVVQILNETTKQLPY